MNCEIDHSKLQKCRRCSEMGVETPVEHKFFPGATYEQLVEWSQRSCSDVFYSQCGFHNWLSIAHVLGIPWTWKMYHRNSSIHVTAPSDEVMGLETLLASGASRGIELCRRGTS